MFKKLGMFGPFINESLFYENNNYHIEHYVFKRSKTNYTALGLSN